MTDPSLWNQLLIWPILNLLMGFYKLFTAVNLPGAFGWAIIALTLLVRMALLPLTRAQIKSARKIQKLKPRLDELQKKHKDDKVKLQQAQLALYQEVGVNPASGCLPLLIQLPVFIAVYRVFLQLLNGNISRDLVDQINKVLYHPALHISDLNIMFFGADLTVRPNQWQEHGLWLLIIPPLTGALQYFQTRLMTPSAPQQKDEKDKEDQALAMQKQMSVIMPVMIGFFAFSFPIGLALYWNSITLFGIIQQYRLKQETS